MVDATPEQTSPRYTLAVETSIMTTSVALLDGDGLIAEQTVRTARGHASKLLPMIDTMMSASGFKYSGVFTYRLRYQFAEPSEISTPCNMPLPKNQCSDSPVCGLAPFLRSRPLSALGMVPLTVRFSAVVSSKTGAKLSFNQNGVSSTSA